MEIGDEILIRVKVVDFDSNPHGPAVKVEVIGAMEYPPTGIPAHQPFRFWIHRLDQPEVIVQR